MHTVSDSKTPTYLSLPPIESGRRVLFLSDVHLPLYATSDGQSRVDNFLSWLQEIGPGVQYLFLVGDIFDFWFEYKNVIPRSYFPILAELHRIASQSSVFFTGGNHDMWVGDYIEKEIGITCLDPIQCIQIDGKYFYLAHGDGLGETARLYKWLKKHILTSTLGLKCFRLLHPDIGFLIAKRFCRVERRQNRKYIKGRSTQILMDYSKKIQIQRQQEGAIPIDYFIMGHSHEATLQSLNEKSQYLNPGSWMGDSIHYGEYIPKKGLLLRKFR
ncbi:MAG: UDP-2,3-diacylglucosamine diphosphatase [Cytophagales bacterium]|nr:UDP-2,3-diacylglucosamine diphosphatase [Cytophagales bacterium]